MKRLALLLPLLALALPAFAHDPAPNAPDLEDSIGATESGDFVYPDYPPWPFASHSEEGATGVRASLLVNSHPSFSGVELALGANDADETVGGQFSMVVNFGGDFSGLQASSVNLDRTLQGVSFGLLLDAVAGDAAGVQLGGLIAKTDGSFSGFQGSFLLAGTGDRGTIRLKRDYPPSPWSYGVQAAGLFAIADRFQGVQMAFTASARDMCGIQVGGVTQALSLDGVQFGLVNDADELHGLQVGLYNRARGGAGVQIGFVNGFGPPGDALWLPVVNARF